jgi:CBS domain-containing protein
MFQAYEPPCARGNTDRNMNVGDICRRDVATVTANATLVDAARLLCDSGAEAIVAIASSASRPTAIGVVTDRDILRAMLDRGGDLSGLNVVDILSRRPLVLSEDEGLQDAVAKLQSRGVEYAPVVGPGGTLCGAISQRDLLAHRPATRA